MRRDPALVVLPDPDTLASHVADWMLDRLQTAQSPIAVALSGGSTPAGLFSRLGQPEFAHRFPWQRIHWFWGDERFVSRDSLRSNFRLAWMSFLSRVPVPPENIHPVMTERSNPETAAHAYESELQQFYGGDRIVPERPLFHINLLGLGEDGHFASLFPASAALDERSRWSVVTERDGELRISLTYPVLESSRYAAFLVEGTAKSAILPRMLAGDPALPAGRFSPMGALCVFADGSAAAKLATTRRRKRGNMMDPP